MADGIRPSAICCLLSAFHSVDQCSSFEVRDRQEIAFDRHRCVAAQNLQDQSFLSHDRVLAPQAERTRVRARRVVRSFIGVRRSVWPYRLPAGARGEGGAGYAALVVRETPPRDAMGAQPSPLAPRPFPPSPTTRARDPRTIPLPMRPVITPAESMRLDEITAVPEGVLLERAGLAVALAAARMGVRYGSRVLVLTGTGNNGGDGWVAARHLRRRGVDVVVRSLGYPKGSDSPPDCHERRDPRRSHRFRSRWPRAGRPRHRCAFRQRSSRHSARSGGAVDRSPVAGAVC